MGDHHFGYIRKLGEEKKKSLLTITIESIIIIILFLKI
jgi:hypothetical protein